MPLHDAVAGLQHTESAEVPTMLLNPIPARTASSAKQTWYTSLYMKSRWLQQGSGWPNNTTVHLQKNWQAAQTRLMSRPNILVRIQSRPTRKMFLPRTRQH